VAIQNENAALRQELQPIFYSSSVASQVGSGIAVSDDAGLFQAADRLFDLCAQNDRNIGMAFVMSSVDATAAGIKSPQFWHSMGKVERLASEIEQATLK